MARSIRTTKQDIYINLVSNAASQEGQKADSADYIFDYQYELFSLSLAVGYLEGERIEVGDDQGWSQEILRLSNLDEDHTHRVSIELINQLVLMEVEEADLEVLGDEYDSPADVSSPDDVWPLVLRYADWGVEHVEKQISMQGDLDLVALVRDAGNPEWRERLRNVIVHPDAQNR